MENRMDVAIIVGSGSDLEVVNETVKTLEKLGVTYSLRIASAHRTTEHLKQCIEGAESTGAKVFIAAAGMAAALPGVVASETTLPVIGIPIKGKGLAGMDSLFSIVQMPKGVPVACVALGKAGAVNAAVLAAQIIGLFNDTVREKLAEFKKQMSEGVVKEDLKLQKDGIDKYIEGIKK